MRYDSQHKDRIRQRVLTETAAALRVEGPERIGPAKVMGKLGLTHGGFYAHFRSKEDLLVHAIDAIFEQTHAWLLKKTEGLPPEEALASYVDFYLSSAHSDALGRGCALPALAADVSRMEPAARRRFSLGSARLQRVVADLFVRLGQEDEKAEESASSLFAEMAGAIALARAVDTPEQAHLIRTRSLSVIRSRIKVEPVATTDHA